MEKKTIEGDLIQIQIFGKNEIALIILTEKTAMEDIYERVEYRDNKSITFIRKNILPMTHIKLIVYEGYYTNSRTLKGLNILEYNEPLKHGHYICPLCGYDYGTNKNCENKFCMICGCKESKLEYVTDFYK